MTKVFPKENILHRFAAGLLEAFGFIVAVCTVAGSCANVMPILDICANFRFQLALGLGFIAIALFLLRRQKNAAVAAVLALLNAVLILPLFWGGTTAQTNGPKMKLMHANVLKINGEAHKLIQLIKSEQPAVLLLEEVDQHWLDAMKVLEATYPHKLVMPRDDNFGIALYSLYPFEGSIIYPGGSQLPSAEVTLLDSPLGPLRIYGTHPVPPMGLRMMTMRNELLSEISKLAQKTQQEENKSCVVLGDFNTSPFSQTFKLTLKASGLQDSTRGFGYQSTWPAQLGTFGIPLDHCLHSPDLATVSRRIGPDIGSDHRPLILELAPAAKP